MDDSSTPQTRPTRIIFIGMTVLVILGLCFGTFKAYANNTTVPALVAETGDETVIHTEDAHDEEYSVEVYDHDDDDYDNVSLEPETTTQVENVPFVKYWRSIFIISGILLIVVSLIILMVYYHAYPKVILPFL